MLEKPRRRKIFSLAVKTHRIYKNLDKLTIILINHDKPAAIFVANL